MSEADGGSGSPADAGVEGPARRRRVSVLAAIPVAVFAGLLALFAIRLGAGDPSRLPSALIGRKVPVFDLPALAGLQDGAGRPVPGLASPDLSAGRVTVVNVWASWCAPCREEHPLLLEIGRRGGFRLAGLAYKDKPDNSRRFLGTFGNPFTAVGTDPEGRAGIELGVYGVPETFVIGPDGTVRHRQVGPLTPETLPGFLEEVRKAAR